jgi:hypothetical protein
MEEAKMKNHLFVLIFFLITFNSFAGGIYEYNGKNYLYSPYSGNYAVAYENEEHQEQVNQYSAVIYNRNFYFIGLGMPTDGEDVFEKGCIENGDRFVISDNHPEILAVYNGPRKQIPSGIKNTEPFVVVGYATIGNGIFLTEIILNNEELTLLESKLREIE